MSKLLEVLPAKDIYFIAMNREFHGKKWLKRLALLPIFTR